MKLGRRSLNLINVSLPVIKPNTKELRSYGWMMGAVLGGLFGLTLPLVFRKHFPLWPWYGVCFFWFFAAFYPRGLRPVYQGWMIFGHYAGKINTTLILSVVYFVLFLPLAVWFRLIKRDKLHRRFDVAKTTYREPITQSWSPETMENPF